MASTSCPKCGNGHVRATYLPKRDLVRKSCGCGYIWEQPPVKESEDTAAVPLREPAR